MNALCPRGLDASDRAQDCEDGGRPLPDVLSNFSAEIAASIERHSDLQGHWV
jgi:hypothetical protein